MVFSPDSNSVSGSLIRLADNYVVFSERPDESFIAADPPDVATRSLCSCASPVEEWLDTPVARGLRQLTVDLSSRNLRTRNKQQPHRHIRIDVDSASWREQVGKVIADCGVEPLATR